MGNLKVVLNSSGVRNLLKSPEMQQTLKKHADRIATKAGGCEVYVAQTRAVVTAGAKGSDNGLLRALK